MAVVINGKTHKAKILKSGGLILDLSNKKIEDLEQIKGLDQLLNLEYLILDDNNITEIKCLENLTNLKELSIKRNKLSEIKELQNLKNLQILDLSENNITEIKGIDKLLGLTKLILWKNQIKDLKGLHNQSKLKVLALLGNPVYSWIQQNFGEPPYKEAAIQYCRKLYEGDNYDFSEIEVFLKNKKSEIKNIIEKTSKSSKLRTKSMLKAHNNIIDILRVVFRKMFEKKKFFKFFGEIFKIDPNFFNVLFFDLYNKRLVPIMSTVLKFEFEKYVLENFCFYPQEKHLIHFLGEIPEVQGGFEFIGRFYTTNFRIIAQGIYQKKDKVFYGGFDLLEDILSIPDKWWEKRQIVKNYKKSKKDDSKTHRLHCFGYEFSYNFKKIKVKRNSIRLGKNHIILTQITNESKDSYYKRANKITKLIQNAFLNYHK